MVDRAAILYNDYAANAVFDGGSYLSSMPLSNVQDGDPKVVARSTTAANADTLWNVNLGAIRPIGGYLIGPCNLYPGDTYRIRSYADAARATVKYDSGVVTPSLGTAIDWTNTAAWLEWEDPNFWMGVVPSDVAELPFYIIGLLSAADILAGKGNAQFWRGEFYTATNPDGHLDTGLVEFFRLIRPPKNFAPDDNAFDMEFLEDMAESDGGLRTYNSRADEPRRNWRVSFPSLPTGDAFGDWFKLALKSRTSKHVVLIPNEADTGDVLRMRAFPATFRKAPPIAQRRGNRSSVVVDGEEVI